jgi:hypothetical protein
VFVVLIFCTSPKSNPPAADFTFTNTENVSRHWLFVQDEDGMYMVGCPSISPHTEWTKKINKTAFPKSKG